MTGQAKDGTGLFWRRAGSLFLYDPAT